jgi:hypothetical protein
MMVPSHALRRVTWRHTIQRHYVCSQSTRLLSYSFQPRSPRKDSQDRESINTEATEYTRSGTDDSVAHTEVAFDDKVTSPEGEKDTAAKRDKVSSHAVDYEIVACMHDL